MNVDDLLAFYEVKNDAELAKSLSLTKGTISKWRNVGVSSIWQVCFELKTDGKLKADHKKLPNIPVPDSNPKETTNVS